MNNDDNKPSKLDLTDAIFPMRFEGPMQMTFDNITQEITVKCLMQINPNVAPMQAHLSFTKDGTGHLFGGILEMVNKGMVTVTPGEQRILQ